MVNPMNFKFMLLKTQGEGTEDGPVDILDKVGETGRTYTDNTKELMITRLNGNKILVTFGSGLSFVLAWYGHYGEAQFVKIPQEYTAASQSRGMMGSTPFQNCELLYCYVHLN